jgi:DNA-binding XRE family transcriptional regulator
VQQLEDNMAQSDEYYSGDRLKRIKHSIKQAETWQVITKTLAELQALEAAGFIPHRVVDLIIDKDFSPVRAWREYLELTQEEVAKRIGISQAAYSLHERSPRLKKKMRQTIADALGISVEQLSLY